VAREASLKGCCTTAPVHGCCSALSRSAAPSASRPRVWGCLLCSAEHCWEGLLHHCCCCPLPGGSAARTQEWRALLFLLRACYTHLPAAGPLLPEQGDHWLLPCWLLPPPASAVRLRCGTCCGRSGAWLCIGVSRVLWCCATTARLLFRTPWSFLVPCSRSSRHCKQHTLKMGSSRTTLECTSLIATGHHVRSYRITGIHCTPGASCILARATPHGTWLPGQGTLHYTHKVTGIRCTPTGPGCSLSQVYMRLIIASQYSATSHDRKATVRSPADLPRVPASSAQHGP